jgi:hypothetical protein
MYCIFAECTPVRRCIHTYILHTYIVIHTVHTLYDKQNFSPLHIRVLFFNLTDVKDKAEIEKLKAELAALRKKASEEESRRLREENEKAALEIEAVAKSQQETETLKVCIRSMYVCMKYIYIMHTVQHTYIF